MKKILSLLVVMIASILFMPSVYATAKYTVKFDANGGKNTTKKITCTINKKCTLTKNNFTRKGYVFTGWNTKKDGSGKTYKDAAKVKNIGKKNKTVKLYAQWKGTYTIKFNGNGTNTWSNYNSPITCTIGKKCKLTKNGFKKTGYDFIGWNTKKDGTGKTYKNKAKVKNLVSKPNGTITLYAMWQAKTYNITYDLNGGTIQNSNPTSYIYGKKLKLEYEPVKDGNIFDHWSIANNDSNNTSKITAIWKYNTSNIIYNLDGGVNNKNNPTYYIHEQPISLKIPTKSGYKFLGWFYQEQDGSSEPVRDFSLINDNEILKYFPYSSKIIYAKWGKTTFEDIKQLLIGNNGSIEKVFYYDSINYHPNSWCSCEPSGCDYITFIYKINNYPFSEPKNVFYYYDENDNWIGLSKVNYSRFDHSVRLIFKYNPEAYSVDFTKSKYDYNLTKSITDFVENNLNSTTIIKNNLSSSQYNVIKQKLIKENNDIENLFNTLNNNHIFYNRFEMIKSINNNIISIINNSNDDDSYKNINNKLNERNDILTTLINYINYKRGE